MKQIIKCYKSKEDFYQGKELNFNFCMVNENEGFAETFRTIYARGIMEGMRVKYARPFVAVWEYEEKGECRVSETYGGQNLR